MAQRNRSGKEGQAKPKAKRGTPKTVRGGKDDPAGGGGFIISSVRMDPNSWDPASDVSHHKPPLRYSESFFPLGMETGSSNGQPIGQGAEAEGGKRETGVSDGGASAKAGSERAESDLPLSDFARRVHGFASLGTAALAGDGWAIGDYGRDLEKRQAKKRAHRAIVAALLIGLAIGMYIPAAYRLVLGS